MTVPSSIVHLSLLGTLLAGIAACGAKKEPVEIEALIYRQPVVAPADDDPAGRRYALQYCQSCHRYVEPEALSKAVWESYVIPRMGGLLGMHHAGYPYERLVNEGRTDDEKAMIAQAAIYPDEPLVPSAHWDTLAAYLIAQAPDSLPLPDPPIRAATGLPFTVVDWPYRKDIPTTTLVHIDEARRHLWVGDLLTQRLTLLDPSGTVVQDIPVGNAPVSLRRVEDRLWVTSIGQVYPADSPDGEVVVLEEVEGSFRFFPGNRKLAALLRPVHTTYADLNEDGREDLVVSEYGNQAGRLSWYESLAGGRYQRHVLSDQPGSMQSRLHDFNGDGNADIAVVFGQNREGVFIYYNEGAGQFTESYALQIPPHYGTSSFALADFNEDGHIDILATHGDNGDYPPILKPYHGLRIYENNGLNFFEEVFFFPMHGAYDARPEDFDGDGDLDIVAIAMFPDFDTAPEDAFVYLDNQGDYQFTASSTPDAARGRWLTMDVGDLDGDGDKDVVLGSFIRGPSAVPPERMLQWEHERVPLLFLENTWK